MWHNIKWTFDVLHWIKRPSDLHKNKGCSLLTLPMGVVVVRSSLWYWFSPWMYTKDRNVGQRKKLYHPTRPDPYTAGTPLRTPAPSPGPDMTQWRGARAAFTLSESFLFGQLPTTEEKSLKRCLHELYISQHHSALRATSCFSDFALDKQLIWKKVFLSTTWFVCSPRALFHIFFRWS